MQDKLKKIVGYIITGAQVLFFIFWLLTGVNENGLDITKFNFAPIPNIGDMLIFGILVLIIVGLQKIKVKLGVGDDFEF